LVVLIVLLPRATAARPGFHRGRMASSQARHRGRPTEKGFLPANETARSGCLWYEWYQSCGPPGFRGEKRIRRRRGFSPDCPS